VRRVAAIAIAAALTVPAVASAGTATSEGGAARYADAAGAADNLSVALELIGETPDVDPQGWNVLFHSLADPIVRGVGCGAGFVGTICPYGPTPPGALAVDLGAGDDRLELDVKPEAAGATTRIALSGGAGDDAISTVRARAEIDGGDGDDLIKPDERRALDSPPAPTPGGVIRGGAGTDTVDYEQALDPIQVSLDDVANDGRPGESDDVRPDVENVTGSHFGSTLAGSPAANVLIGGDRADRIAGGADRDRLDGRGGDDTIDALDGGAGDRVECGAGEDAAFIDAGDVVSACERVTWAPALAGSSLRHRDGRVVATLRCPKAASQCRGALLVRSAGATPKTLAKARYRMEAGERATLRAKPTRAGRAAFKHRSAKATAFVQPAGATVAAGRVVTVRR
jgi:Ca2+-binding RTX toxin-like protein